jgi:hypothetical protein
MLEQQKIYSLVSVHFLFFHLSSPEKDQNGEKKPFYLISNSPLNEGFAYIYIYTRNVPGEDLTTKLQL